MMGNVAPMKQAGPIRNPAPTSSLAHCPSIPTVASHWYSTCTWGDTYTSPSPIEAIPNSIQAYIRNGCDLAEMSRGPSRLPSPISPMKHASRIPSEKLEHPITRRNRCSQMTS